MSKKKRPALLGPDGKVIDHRQFAKKPEPPRTTTVTTAGGYDLSSDLLSFKIQYGAGILGRSIFGPYPTQAARPRSLADAVADDVDALTAEFDGKGEAELPAPPADLTTYRDAYASAASKCLHADAIEMLYQRQWVCDDCGRTLNRDDMRRARAKRGIWSYFS